MPKELCRACSAHVQGNIGALCLSQCFRITNDIKDIVNNLKTQANCCAVFIEPRECFVPGLQAHHGRDQDAGLDQCSGLVTMHVFQLFQVQKELLKLLKKLELFLKKWDTLYLLKHLWVEAEKE